MKLISLLAYSMSTHFSSKVKRKDEIKGQSPSPNNPYILLHIIYHTVYNYNQLYIARNLRHATVKDAVAVNAKADFRCQNMIRPSFSPTGIIFSTSIFHFDS